MTYYSSNKALLIQKIDDVLKNFYQRYNDYEENTDQKNEIISWTFFISRKPILVIAVVVSSILEAKETSPEFINNIETKTSLKIYTPMR
jgi:hypothetical protein